jgi:hypothetical protein
VQLERAVFDNNVERLPQPVDPSLADVTPRSNKVAKDQKPNRHASESPLYSFRQATWPTTTLEMLVLNWMRM